MEKALLIFALVLGGCNWIIDKKPQNNIPPKPEISTTKEEMPNIGGDLDAHGCNPSAGYTYSLTLQKCIRVWEAGIRLLNVKTPDDPLSIILIENNDKNEMELFIPRLNSAILLNKNNQEWQSKDKVFKITKSDNQQISVYENGNLIAKAAP